MNSRLLGFVFIAGTLFGGNLVAAEENHEEMSIMESEHEQHNMDTTVENHEQEQNGHLEETDKIENQQGHNEHEGTNLEENGHSEQILNEKPPNKLVLGVFGLINLIFLLIGVWNKWLKRKKVEYVDTREEKSTRKSY